MKKKPVEINLHGVLADQMGRDQWKLYVKSVGEAIHAINTLTRSELYKNLLENDKKSIKYEVLINKSPALFAEPVTEKNIEKIFDSELAMNIPNLETIDIVPVIEGADADIGMIIAGIVLIVVAWYLPPAWAAAIPMLQGALVMGGIGLIAVGIINLLSTPPKLDDFRGASRRGSYMFDGPENTVGEGGPVPLVYGQLLVGSQTIATTYSITNEDAGQIITQ